MLEIEALPEPVAEAYEPVEEPPTAVEPVAEVPLELELEPAPVAATEPEPVALDALELEPESAAAAEPVALDALELEPESLTAIEPVAETPPSAEAELEAVSEAEVPAYPEALAKADHAVELWYRDHADEPEAIVRPEGVPADAEATTPATPSLAEPIAGVEAEPAAAEPFPINPELLGEELEPTAAAESSDPLVFQEGEPAAEILAEEPATPVEPVTAIAPEAELAPPPPPLVAAERSEAVAETPATQDEPAKSADLFFGLERDTASFLGGMPLQLAPLQSPFAQQRVDFARPPVPPMTAAQPEPAAPQAEAEEPLPEFDHEAFEYPNESAATAEAVEPAAPAPEVPVAPAAASAGRPASRPRRLRRRDRHGIVSRRRTRNRPPAAWRRARST